MLHTFPKGFSMDKVKGRFPRLLDFLISHPRTIGIAFYVNLYFATRVSRLASFCQDNTWQEVIWWGFPSVRREAAIVTNNETNELYIFGGALQNGADLSLQSMYSCVRDPGFHWHSIPRDTSQ